MTPADEFKVRRDFLKSCALSSAVFALSEAARRPEEVASGPPGSSPVAIFKVKDYSAELLDVLLRGAAECGLTLRGKRVLLKPNLVEFNDTGSINTHSSVLLAAVQMCRALGAREITIAEGPGHRRETMYLAEVAGYRAAVPGFEERFVDLNCDDVSPVRNFLDGRTAYLPNTALTADLVISLPKMKTHHWVGATLAMKNYFGLVPGCVYGWPKNQLHRWGIPASIAALYRVFPRSFAIVDGIVGMEGDGPIWGRPKPAGVVVMGRDLVAVDSTCCRIMGLNPMKVSYLTDAAAMGRRHESGIEQRGESIASVRTDFEVIDQFRRLKLRA